jgi:hypothetical protein
MMQPYAEVIDGVRNQFFRAGTGSKIEEIKSDRPSVNSQNFKKQVMREALQGIGWNYDFTLDATASAALLAGSALRRSTKRSFHSGQLGRPASSRFNFFRISKAIKNGDLPPDVDSWKFDTRGQARFTGDEKYSSDVAIQGDSLWH